MAKTSILTILFQLARKGNADSETISALSKMKSVAATAGLAFGALATVGYTLNKVYQGTAQVFLDNATKVRDLARTSRMSVEEASRMIEAADDMGVSYDVLQKALWNANKNGFKVTIDSISQMADEFVAIEDPTERADYLIKRFGKTGEEMGKILEKGGDGFRKFAESVNDNQIFTDNDIRNAREYEMQLDAFNDQWTALKVSAGKPIVARLLLEMEKLNDLSMIRNELELSGNAARAMQHALARMNEEINSGNLDTATEGYMKMAQAAEYDAQMQSQNSDEMERAAQEAERLAEKQEMVLDVAFRLQDALDSYNEKMADIEKTQQEAQLAYEEAMAKYEKGLITQEEMTQATEDYNSAMAETGAAAEKAAAQHQDAMNRIIFSIIQAQAAADGLTVEESKGLIKIGVQLGLIDQATADMATSMVDSFSDVTNSVKETNDKLYKFNEDVWVARNAQGTYTYRFNILVSGGVPNFAGATVAARRAGIDEYGAGGSGMGGGAYAEGGWMGAGWKVVGEEGYEYISPSGFVFTHEQSQALRAAGLVPEMGFDIGGSLGVEGLRAAARQMRSKYRSSPTTSGTTSESVTQTAQQVAEVSQQATQATVQSNQYMATVTTDLMRTTQETSNALLEEVSKLNTNIENLQDTTVRSIRENMQAVIT